MKIFGLISWIILAAGVTVFFSLLYFVGGSKLVSGVWWIFFGFSVLFARIIVVKTKKVQVYGVFRFLERNNSISLDDISRLSIFTMNGWTTFSFYNKNAELELQCTTGICYKFEIKRLIRELRLYDSGIEIELSGIGAIDW